MYILRIYRPESGYSSVFLCKTSLDYPNLKTYQSGKQIKYKQKESKIPNSITQRKKTVSDNRILQAKESSENLFKIRDSNGELHP